MSSYQDTLISVLSTESGVARASNDSSPTPEDGNLDGIILVAEDDETSKVLEKLASEINQYTKTNVRSFESSEQFLFNNGLEVNPTEDNLVVNGIYIPKLLGKENHYRVPVKVITRNDRTSGLSEDCVYYVVDDDDSETIVKLLRSRNYIAADNPLDLIKALDELRTQEQRIG